MKKKQESIISQVVLDMAKDFLVRSGYTDIQRIYYSDSRVKDNIFLAKSNYNTILVEVMDAANLRSIPLNGLGTSKRAKAKLARLKETAQSLGLETFRLDALWINSATSTAYSHIMNIK